VQAAPHDQLFVVSCYTRFDNLAHGPRGKEAKRSLYTYKLDKSDGQMTLLSVTNDTVMNPAFSRVHPQKNIMYTCTESVAENGQIGTWAVCPETGRLTQRSVADAGGTSTCYLTVDHDCRNMLAVNYWDATIGVFGLDPKTGEVTGLRSMYDPKEGRPMKARADKHVNHSQNDASAQKERQNDPHSHAVILDPFEGQIAFVPDLGMDCIRQFRYNSVAGTLQPAGTIKSGPDGRTALGPRYIEFHPTLPFCYVVNELSSEVSVFEYDHAAAQDVMAGASKPTLRLVQTVRTIPEAWPGEMNTCGRICVHTSGNFVLVSNRGHNSITCFQVEAEGPYQGLLSHACTRHTRGATPRHFQFDGSGQWLIAANQDSDKVSVFWFNTSTGTFDFSGHEYSVPSPNFVCSVQTRPQLEEQPQASDVDQRARLRRMRRSSRSPSAPLQRLPAGPMEDAPATLQPASASSAAAQPGQLRSKL
jgi:6-phosphogluconolactonase